MLQVNALLARHLRPFIKHPMVEQWKQQYDPSRYGEDRRFQTLLLRGASRKGKTCFAESLFGEKNSIIVQCQGLGTNLPSLRHFDRTVHRCIIFDEVSHEQILNNKALFQAGKNVLDLAQSNCGGFHYSIWPYQIAMVCCSNKFATTLHEGLSDVEAEDWLQQNLCIVGLEKNQSWFVPLSDNVSIGACSAAGA